MLKQKSLAAALTFAALVTAPAASQARDCLGLDRGLDRAGHAVTRVADGAGRVVTRVADGVVSLLRCDRTGRVLK